MILPVSPPLLIPWLTCVNSPGFPVHPGVAVYSSLVTTTDGHVRVPDASPNRGSDRLVSGIDSAGSNRGSSQQLSRLLPTPSEEANYSPFYVQSGPGVNSLKKLQVYFTSRTLVLTSLHKFELNIKESLHVPVTSLQLVLTMCFVEINFFKSDFTCAVYSCIKVHL